MKKVKVCFCALSAYPILAGSDIQFIGGAELRQLLIAKELIARGHDVSLISFDYGQQSLEIIDGIKVYRTIPTQITFKNIHTLLSAAYLIWGALKKADADIYYHSCQGLLTGVIALFCKVHRKKFVYQLASDMDADEKYLKELGVTSKIAYALGLKGADRVFTQSTYQQDLMRKNFGLHTEIIKNPFPISGEIKSTKSEPPIVLWVGTIKPEWKQPEVFLNLAQALPEIRFQMVGGPSAKIQYYEQIKEKASVIKNLQFVGFVPYSEVNRYFNSASIFVNTSLIEGFPNTFLQAWAHCVPVVSLNVDPDEVICKYSLGYHSRTFETLIENVKTLVYDKRTREVMGRNGRRYLECEHEISKVVDKYLKFFDEM
jgi:glycosyltransferase involved in cell wall biosynthesis